MDADPGEIAAPSLDFMFAVPVDFSAVPEQAAFTPEATSLTQPV